MKALLHSLLRIGGALALVLVGLLAFIAAMTTMPGRSHQGPLPAPSTQEQELATRLREHVTAIASTEHNRRHYEALEAASAYIESQLAGSGFVVRREEFSVAGKVVRNLDSSIPVMATSSASSRPLWSWG